MVSTGPRTHTNRTRAQSFGSDARAYDRVRPGYPPELIDDLVADGRRAALDVGCGTGKAARLLQARGVEVLGLEIDPRMAEVARGHGVPVVVTAFESWDADGESFDLEGRQIPVIGRPALLKNKRAAGREQDLADVKALERTK